MTFFDFIQKLQGLYTNCKDELEDEIKDLLTRENIIQDPKRLEKLFTHIRDTYDGKFFPKYFEFNKLLSLSGVGMGSAILAYNSDTVREKTKDWPIVMIYDRMKLLRDKSGKRDEYGNDGLCVMDRDFIALWDDIYYIYSDMENKGQEDKQIIAYCGKVKQTILSGEKVFYNPDKLRMAIKDEHIRNHKEVDSGDLF